jgi:hypothetical protein
MSASTAQSSSGNGATVPKIPISQSWSQPSVPSQNTSLRSETTIEPTVPSNVPLTTPLTNVTQPTNDTSVQQQSSSKNLSFPVEVIYGVALGVTVASVVATITTLRKRSGSKQSNSVVPSYEFVSTFFSNSFC